MKHGLIYILAFATGSAAGFLGARRYFSDKYENLYQTEMDSVREHKQRNAETRKNTALSVEEAKEKAELAKEKPALVSYNAYAKGLGTTEEKPEVSKSSWNEPKEAGIPGPYVIAPDNFGDIPEYERVSLTYYKDKVVADDDDRQMSDEEVENAIGMDALTHFGQYEPDSVFVRNERLKCDYEVLLNAKLYADVLKDKPYLQNE